MTSILITGGTGSLGQAIVKKLIANSSFERIVVYSRDEHKQARMHAELNSDKVRYFIGDVRDKDRLKLALQGCWYVVHAAALKIVPSAEYNPMEYVKTNIMGSQNLIDACLDHRNSGTIRVLFISTDKAVNPINLYGATKLCMEKLAVASNNLTPRDAPSAVFSVCRYGNVANSNGSIIPIFKKQYENGGPFTITDPGMTRFWITLDEASEFVLSSFSKMNYFHHNDDGSFSMMGVKGGDIFIPDMPSFKITDLTLAFGSHPGKLAGWCKIIGIRDGEKLHEQIDATRFSNTNDKWLKPSQIREQLISMGVIDG